MGLPSHFGGDIVAVIVFGLLGMVLLGGAYKFWDWMTTRIDEQAELNKGNTAVAIVLVGYMFSVAYIISNVIAHVLGG